MREALRMAMLGLLALCAGSATARDWFTIETDGQRIGYAWHERSRHANGTIDREQLYVTATQMQRRSSIERRLVIERDATGTLRSIAAHAVTGIDENSWRVTSVGDAAAVLPDQLLATLAPLWRGEVPSKTFAYFDPARASVVKLTAMRIDDAASLVHVRTQIVDDASARAQDFWFDRDGRLERREQWQLGVPLIWQRCETACDVTVAVPFDPLDRMLVRSPLRIPARALQRTIRYVMTRADGTAPQLIATPEQAVVIDGVHAIVTICKDCGPRTANDLDDRGRYSQPNAWVQSEHPEIVAFARRAVGSSETVATRMPRLIAAVRERMTGSVNVLGYASAVEAYRSRSGDCTEFAVLLAALARAQGISTRVVVGVVYADRFGGRKDVFCPHSWVQAWDGQRWRSYDAALEDFDATHIALAVGDGSPRQFEAAVSQLANLRIDKAGLLAAK
jgi:hypothetical protein